MYVYTTVFITVELDSHHPFFSKFNCAGAAQSAAVSGGSAPGCSCSEPQQSDGMDCEQFGALPWHRGC